MQHMYTYLTSMGGLLELMSTSRHGGFKIMFRHESVSETVTKGTFSAIISF